MPKIMDEITLTGGEPSQATTVNVYLRNANNDRMLCEGSTVPTNGTKGYAKACMFLKLNVATGTGGMYFNKGTNASCAFTLATQA